MSNNDELKQKIREKVQSAIKERVLPVKEECKEKKKK